MKKVFSNSFLFLLFFITYGFVLNNKEYKIEPVHGEKQIFVHSYREILLTSNRFSPYSFKMKKNNEIIEGFQMYTFRFDENKVEHNYLYYRNEKTMDTIMDKTLTYKLTLLKNDGAFAVYKFIDQSNYYSNQKNKYFIINLKDNPNFPALQVLWKNGNKWGGAYSVDQRDFNQLFNDSNTNIFRE
jgi:hypothetical protein